MHNVNCNGVLQTRNQMPIISELLLVELIKMTVPCRFHSALHTVLGHLQVLKLLRCVVQLPRQIADLLRVGLQLLPANQT